MISNIYSSEKLKIMEVIQKKTDLENYYQEGECKQDANLADHKENIFASEQHEPE